METQVGLFDAKTHLSALVEQAEQGGEIIITRRGKPVARLVPYEKNERDQESRKRVKKAINRMRKLRDGVEKRRVRLGLPPLTQKDIKAMIEEGRR